MTARQVSAPLKLHSNRAWMPPQRHGAHVTILCPFWGRRRDLAIWADYADRLIADGRSFLELGDLESADVVVFPYSGRPLLREPDGLERAAAVAHEARSTGKPCVFFFDPADGSERWPLADVVVFRGSLFRSRQMVSEFALPSFHDDLLAFTGRALPLRAKDGIPSVSFCGSLLREREPATARARVRRRVGTVKRRIQKRHDDDLYVRSRAIDALQTSRDVRADIVIRGPAESAWSDLPAERWAALRREYVDNVVGADYVLCARGAENYSFRLYEALCLGRIPIVIDTDVVLPYDFVLGWRDYCVWLERGDVTRIGEKVAEFHDRLSPADFVERQHECRRLWEDYLCPLGFFRNFHRHLDFLPAA